MRVVVTGATGNVGLAVVAALLDAGVDSVVGVARGRPRSTTPYDDVRFGWRSADVGVDDLAGALVGADAVIHLAWRFQPTRRRAVTWRANVIGTQRVLDAAARAEVATVVIASSVGAYAPVAGRPFAGPAGQPLADADAPVDETWPTGALPTAAYGIEKSYLERAIDAFEPAHRDIRLVRIRSAFVFHQPAAPEQWRIFAGRLLPAGIVGAKRLPLLPVPGGLRFQTVHGADLAAAYVAAVLRPARGAFNVAADPVIDTDALAGLFDAHIMEIPPRLTRAVMAAGFRLHVIPAEPGLLELFMSLPIMATSRARSELGWSPRHSSIDALDEFLAGLRQPSGGPTRPLHRS